MPERVHDQKPVLALRPGEGKLRLGVAVASRDDKQLEDEAFLDAREEDPHASEPSRLVAKTDVQCQLAVEGNDARADEGRELVVGVTGGRVETLQSVGDWRVCR